MDLSTQSLTTAKMQAEVTVTVQDSDRAKRSWFPISGGSPNRQRRSKGDTVKRIYSLFSGLAAIILALGTNARW